MGARPYDPNLGRFLAVDPIHGGSLNNYDYAGQDPIDNYDLSGTMTRADGGGCPQLEIGGYCTEVMQLAVTGPLKGALVRLVEVATSRMSRAAAERVVARMEGPITRAANKLGYSAKVVVDDAHHYFPEFGQKAEHIQVTVWRAGVKGSDKAVRFAINIFR